MVMMFLVSSILALTLQPAAPAAPAARSDGAKPPPQNVPVRQTQRDYVIGVQDQLLITVLGEPELTNKFRVENDGFITFPYLEKVPAAGKTLNDLQDLITAMLKNGYLANPQVRVEVDEYRSQRVFVTGQVRSPNEYTMTGATMTLLQALAAAGSPTADAASEVVVSRRGSNGENEIIRVSLRDLELGRKDIPLQDGDVINVPKAQTFFIDGYVRNPGLYVIDAGLTVQQAIALAGGLSDRGSDRGIKASRVVNGKQVEVDVRLTDLVQAGDTIKIRSRFF